MLPSGQAFATVGAAMCVAGLAVFGNLFSPKMTLFDEAKLFNHPTAALCWKWKIRPGLQVPYNCPVYFNTPYTKLQISLTARRSSDYTANFTFYPF